MGGQERKWTAEEDAHIITRRKQGIAWHKIADEITASRNAIIRRAHQLEEKRKSHHAHATERIIESRPRGAGASALKPGDPLTWSLISSDPFPDSKP